jgi:hypothetical protein
MQNPCYGCVSPKRCPGCHDHCPERLQYVEQVLIPQRHYEKEYCSGFSINTVAYDRAMRQRKRKGESMGSHMGGFFKR